MNTTDDKLGFAVVGLGVGEQHARKVAELPECELRILCDYDGDKARSLADSLGVPKTATRFEAVLKDDSVAAVVIASFDHDHAGQVMAALEAGKHVFVEKPICQTQAELRQIKQLWVQKSDLKLASNLILRTAPLYRWLKQQFDNGALGNVYSVDGEYLFGRLEKITHGWRKDVPNYSVMQGGGIHMIDLMLWITGQRPESVYALGNRISSEGTDFRYNDFTSALLAYPSGLVGRLTANFGCVHRHHHVLRVYGTEATFLYDDSGPRLHTSRDPGEQGIPLDHAPVPAHKGDLISEFVSAILNDADWSKYTQTFFDGISICIASDQSVLSCTSVKVEYV